MKETELRELDAWIAKHVMKFNDGGEYWFPENLTKAEAEDDYNPNQRLDKAEYDPTGNPLWAFEVLKKCAIRSAPPFEIWADGTIFYVGGQGEDIAGLVESQTLELAICQFAKKLFTK